MPGIRILALVLTFCLPLPTISDTADNAARDDYAQSRKLLIESNLQLSPEEAARFWPVYERYWNELSALTARRELYYSEFGNNFDSMTDDLAKKITLGYIGVEEDRYRLLKSFFPKFAGALTAKKAARYYQIEAKIQAAVNSEIAARIPLLK